MTSMTPTRIWTAAITAACVLLAAIAWFFLVGPQRATAADAWTELEGVEGQSAALRTRIAGLERQMTTIDTIRADVSARAAALPPSDELDAFQKAVYEAGRKTNVVVEAITPEEPVDLTPAPPPAPEPAEGEAADDQDAAAAAPPEPAGPPLFAIPVQLRVVGSYADVASFVRVLQQEQPRAVLVVGGTGAPSLGGTTFSTGVVLTLEANVFVSQDGAGA